MTSRSLRCTLLVYYVCGAYFLRSTPPIVGSTGGGGSLGHFIPPRNRSDSINGKSVTPPFQPRPLGFIQQTHDPPTMFLEPSTTSRLYESSDVPSRNSKTLLKTAHAPSQPPVTSLDSLRSSPFQQSQQLTTLQQQQNQVPDIRSTMFSSLAAAVLPPPISSPGGAIGGGMEFSDYLTAPMSLAPSLLLDVNSSSSLRRSLWGQRSTIGGSGVMPSSMAGLAGRHQQSYFDEYSNDEYSEEMPFALELPTPSILDGSTALSQQHSKSGAASKMVGASSTFGTSSSLAALAQKCSVPNQRLKMFDKRNSTISSGSEHNGVANSEIDEFTNSLADQLQEFRAFGASLPSSSVQVVVQQQQQQQQHETNAHHNFGGGDDRHVLTGSGTSSTSTPISLKS